MVRIGGVKVHVCSGIWLPMDELECTREGHQMLNSVFHA